MTESEPIIKPIWTDADYESMGWHDCPIHGIAFQNETDGNVYESLLLLDIDYIFEWIKTDGFFEFRMSPCTLVFELYNEVAIDWSLKGFWPVQPEISRLTMELLDEHPEYRFREYRTKIELFPEGSLTMITGGFTQYVRKPPRRTSEQVLDYEYRGLPCFDRITY